MDTKIVDYSEKAIAVFGDTYPIRDVLKNCGGTFNRNLKHPAGLTAPGWIFSRKRLPELQNALREVIQEEECRLSPNPESAALADEIPTTLQEIPIESQSEKLERKPEPVAIPVVPASSQKKAKPGKKAEKEMNLQSALKLAKVLLKKKHVLPICETLLITPEGITVTDLDHSLTVKLEIPINRPICLHPDALLMTKGEILESIEVTEDQDNFTARIKTNYKTVTFAGENPDDFPRIPQKLEILDETLISCEITEKVLCAAKCIATDEEKATLSRVFWGKQEKGNIIAGTDAHRLAWFVPETAPAIPVTFPAKVLKLIQSGKLETTENNHWLTTDSFTLVWRTCDQKYPEVMNVVPTENPISFTAGSQDLYQACAATKAARNKTSHQVKFTLAPGKLEICAENKDFETETKLEIQVQSVGEIEIGFNGELFEQMMNLHPTGTVTVEMSTPNRAAVIRYANGEKGLLMPVMLDGYGA
jgi:DNA polymerase-3 subunit beta